MTWLDTFLPKLCCPHTKEGLRVATADERQRAGLAHVPVALINESASYVYPVIENIPHLLPGSAVLLSPAAI